MTRRLNVHTIEVSPTIHRGLRRAQAGRVSPDQLYQLALLQHEAFRDALCRIGAVCIHHHLYGEDCNDTHFAEDSLTILPDLHSGEKVAILHRMGAPERSAEVQQVQRLANNIADRVIDLRQIGDKSTTVDGGDLKVVGNLIFAGFGKANGRAPRTTPAGIRQLMKIVAPMGYTIIPIAHKSLHFTTECGFFGRSPRDGRPVLAITPAMLEAPLEMFRAVSVFGQRLDIIEIPETELMSGNGIGFGGAAIVQRGFSALAEALDSRGFKLQFVDFSAFQEVDGGPSCLCVFEDNPMALVS